jgi:hypothetical protein
MRFDILKGGSQSWINVWNLILKHHLPLMKKFHPRHQNIHLDDVIERIERLNLDGNAAPSQSMEQPGPSQKGPLSGS